MAKGDESNEVTPIAPRVTRAFREPQIGLAHQPRGRQRSSAFTGGKLPPSNRAELLVLGGHEPVEGSAANIFLRGAIRHSVIV